MLPSQIEALRAALQGTDRLCLSLPGFREAAVLVPLVLPPPEHDAAEAELLFTVRHDGLSTHPGQIAFPGGKRDPEDESLIHTALREAEEELGLDAGTRASIQVLGLLDDVPTPAGFVITPVVGVVRGPLHMRPSEREVGEVFQVPLSHLPKVHKEGPRGEWMGVRYVMQEYLYGRFRIWGATAAMVRQLLSILGR